MGKKSPVLVFVLGVFLLAGFGAAGLLAAEEKDEGPTFEYVGVKKCKMCHNTESQGKQYAIWEASGHAKAFEVLASEKAMAAAKEHGIENPQEAPECLKCHATAFHVMDMEEPPISLEEGVGCESCHGPGSEYKSKKVKEAVKAGEIEAASVGLLTPNEETCKQCHTPEGNDFYKEFNFEERVKKIAHPRPTEE